jgi:hypothetical protein
MDALDLHSGFDVVVIPRSARGVRFPQIDPEVAPSQYCATATKRLSAFFTLVAVPQSLSGAGLRQTRV